jgi:hypothetical protein
MQHRQRLNDLVEREWSGSPGSRRGCGFSDSLVALSSSNAWCECFGWNAQFEPAKVFGEFALALDQRDPRSSAGEVLETTLGIRVTLAAGVASMFSGVDSFGNRWSMGASRLPLLAGHVAQC